MSLFRRDTSLARFFYGIQKRDTSILLFFLRKGDTLLISLKRNEHVSRFVSLVQLAAIKMETFLPLDKKRIQQRDTQVALIPSQQIFLVVPLIFEKSSMRSKIERLHMQIGRDTTKIVYIWETMVTRRVTYLLLSITRFFFAQKPTHRTKCLSVALLHLL